MYAHIPILVLNMLIVYTLYVCIFCGEWFATHTKFHGKKLRLNSFIRMIALSTCLVWMTLIKKFGVIVVYHQKYHILNRQALEYVTLWHLSSLLRIFECYCKVHLAKALRISTSKY